MTAVLVTSAKSDRDFLLRTRARADFVAFASIIGNRIDAGRAHSVYLMLCSLGMDCACAWNVIEDWPKRRTNRAKALYMTIQEQRTVFLATLFSSTVFPDGFEKHDWNKLLLSALVTAERQEDSKA